MGTAATMAGMHPITPSFFLEPPLSLQQTTTTTTFPLLRQQTANRPEKMLKMQQNATELLVLLDSVFGQLNCY